MQWPDGGSHHRPPGDRDGYGQYSAPPPGDRDNGHGQYNAPPPGDRDNGHGQYNMPPPGDRDNGYGRYSQPGDRDRENGYGQYNPPPTDGDRGYGQYNPPPSSSSMYQQHPSQYSHQDDLHYQYQQQAASGYTETPPAYAFNQQPLGMDNHSMSADDLPVNTIINDNIEMGNNSSGSNEIGGIFSNSADNQNKILYGNDLSQVDKDYIFEGLKKLYRKKVLPLELASKYGHFGSPPMGSSDFEAKPMVLILGQYSVGKTSFIRSLLKQDFPGQRIGPEPTTDRFTAIMHTPEGQESGRHVPGHALVMQTDKPFRALASFGNNFLSKFEGAEVSASILKNITIIDTPGVLAGEKQRLGRDYDHSLNYSLTHPLTHSFTLGRDYDFSEIVRWFADRADMIIIMFDAHKLDISDELKDVLDTLKPHQDKIRVLLNKADTIDSQSLLRVYGALMWSLGKVVQTPEVSRVYLGSFWDNPPKLEENRILLEREKSDLLNEMMRLQQNAVVRRINELVKRARSVKVHAYILHYLKKQMPYVMGKSEKQQALLDRLDKEFLACARRYNLPLGDFPPVEQYRKMLREIKDISGFKKLDKNLVYEMDKVLTDDIPALLQKATSKPTQSAYQNYAPYPPQWR